MDVKEIKIEVPWGHIAVKAWGNEDNQAILVFHGIGDNAGSYDGLIPLLSSSFYYICVDFPSHGLSSPYPSYSIITSLHNVYVTMIVAEYFRRHKYIVIGYNWGAQTSTLYTQLYRQRVLKLILIDSLVVLPVTDVMFQNTLTEIFDGMDEITKKAVSLKPTVYTYEEAVNKMKNERDFDTFTSKSLAAVLKRALVPIKNEKNKYTFFGDPRLKYNFTMICGNEYMEKITEKYPIECPTLLVASTKSEETLTYFQGVLENFKGNNANFKIVRVDGNHNLHNKPEKVAPIINKFLCNNNSKL